MLEIFYYPFNWITDGFGRPFVIPGLLGLWYYVNRGRMGDFPNKFVLGFIVFWLLYAIYETYLNLYWLKPLVGPPIRVDLVFLVPILNILFLGSIYNLIKFSF